MRSIAFLVVVALLVGCITRPAARPPLDPLVQELVREHRFMGALVISVHGTVVHESAHGYADLEAGRAFTLDTPSDAGSIAKTFTAAAIHALLLEGRLSLDDSVRSHLPAFPHDATRLRHLLSHSAGLPSYAAMEKRAAGRALDNATLLALLRDDAAPPAFVPGSRFEYDNVAYDMAALVVEAASGRRYEPFLAEQFLRPLGMLGTFVRPARFSDWPGPRTRGYRFTDGTWKPADAYDNEGFHGGGNVYLSARDLHRWAAAHARGTVLPGINSPRATLDDGRPLGLTLASWYGDGRNRGYYLGEHEGFHALCYWDRRRGIAIGLVSNSGLPQWVKPAMARRLIAWAEGAPAAPLGAPSPATQPPTLPASWTLPTVGHIAIDRVEGRMRLTPPSGVPYPMFQVEKLTWYVPGLDSTVRFHGAAPPSWSSPLAHDTAR